ncbi:DUF1835 domain-containing protein [Pseudomonas sp. MWU16-30317]|uniref:DUF1835 domain-containing protein n=1 Tax=Pseudomonas sp. MWU16-30317 TaxID=2878095 RepID=UPI001CFBE5FB|nr:DUF1835 domain-containing protein [Pseudomonas sp. MWU16-30317]
MSVPRIFSPHHGRLNLEQLKKQAKDLLRELHAGSAPKHQAQLKRSPATLTDAQWLIARGYGFATWPKLKAHVDAIDFAARQPDFTASDEANSCHWRCGNDIEHSLRLAGFKGRFQMMADPLCMGPVQALPVEAYRAQRSQYISQVFNLPLADVQRRTDHEYDRLAQLGDTPGVLWCEADAYDQLFLVSALAGLDRLPEHRLELVQINAVPGVQRFIGIGQLAPDLLAWLWPQRRAVTAEALALARRTWAAYCAASPLALAAIADAEHPSLPLLAPALRRQLQELPGVRDGLSLTERLALQTLLEGGEMPCGRVFAELMEIREPLPYLGDMMFYAMMRPLIDGARPLISETGKQLDWPQRPLQLTALGQQVLAGEAYWPDHADAPRWIGGVCIQPREPHWAMGDDGRPVWRG